MADLSSMKTVLFSLCFLLVFSLQITAQGKYTFQYRVETRKQVDTGYVYLESKKEKDNKLSIAGKIVYHAKAYFFFTAIGFLNGDQAAFANADSSDHFNLTLLPGTYKIVFSTPGLRFPVDTLVLENPAIEKILFIIDRSTPDAFLIHSKRVLSKEEIDKIKECVEENCGFDKCQQKELYYFGIEI